MGRSNSNRFCDTICPWILHLSPEIALGRVVLAPTQRVDAKISGIKFRVTYLLEDSGGF